jgi:mannose-1-phosphate guanylyltransferase
MYGVILAGGVGKRFWPASRLARPKQFLDVTGEGSMLALTYRRLTAFIAPDKIFLLTLADQLPRVREELPAIPAERIFAEPVGRNTAPSIAVAAVLVRAAGGDEPFLCCPADHVITRQEEFARIVRAAAALAAERDVLVTFGVVPGHPATGYGYIEGGREADTREGVTFAAVARFHEKPDAERAREYVASGSCLWNSGIFLFRPSVYLEAWGRYVPAGRAPLEAIERSLGGAAAGAVAEREYPGMPSISIDYAILEKAGNVVVARADIGWSDVGSWDSLFELLAPDGEGNVGSGRTVLVDSRKNLFFNPGGVTAAVGVDDLVVVVDGKTVLVCRRGESQRVRELADEMERRNLKDLL